MNAFEVNKIVGSFLMSVLIALLIGQFSNFLVGPRVLTKPVYMPSGEAAKPESGPATAPEIPPVAPLLATANAETGKVIFKQCSSCHEATKTGKNGNGPLLWGVVGRHKGSEPGFAYSNAMQAAAQKEGEDGTWTYEQINRFLAGPKLLIPGTKMGFVGLRKPEDRANVIAYLRGQSDNPLPLP